MNPLVWLKANPLYAAGGAGAVGLGLIAAKKHKSAAPAAGTIEAGSTGGGAPYDSTSSDTYNALEGMIENLQSQIDNGGVGPAAIPLGGVTANPPGSTGLVERTTTKPWGELTGGPGVKKPFGGRGTRPTRSTNAKGRRLPIRRRKGNTAGKLPLPPRPVPVVHRRPRPAPTHKPQPSPTRGHPPVIYAPPVHPAGMAGIGSGAYVNKAAHIAIPAPKGQTKKQLAKSRKPSRKHPAKPRGAIGHPAGD